MQTKRATQNLSADKVLKQAFENICGVEYTDTDRAEDLLGFIPREEVYFEPDSCFSCSDFN